MHARCRYQRFVVAAALLAVGVSAGRAAALSTAFTYQGRLQQNGTAVSGVCDFQFGLFDAAAAGNPVGTSVTAAGVGVDAGLFTTQLDFGAPPFNGSDRWLEISVRCPAGSGSFTTLSPRQPLTAAPYALFAPPVARDAAGNQRAELSVLQTGEGFMSTQGPMGNNNVALTTLLNNPNNGFVQVSQNGNPAAEIYAFTDGSGSVATVGPNGKLNVILSSTSTSANRGFVGVFDENGTQHAAMFINGDGKGEIDADVKNFAVDYPNRPGTKIVYTSLEGPEAAIYDRGVVRLAAGRATIVLPDHFTALADPASLTVQLTPASAASQGLAFTRVHDGRIEIRELHHGRGSYAVDFLVQAVRRGYENRKPVMSSAEFQRRAGLRAGALTASRMVPERKQTAQR